ncbi:DUF554 domain-containing protein [Paenibacillus agricola]|uniref:DUF554 domain-containing protein n=1 Tax=Paenibacillus agricola TaxID=2716264 RepID=A0ABX0JC86_9BACL|nr:DUF554 domain-containing protein [Paenibacillus agricola]NHN32368.1 DUF554 domain-containing protein [Paenibacillus agricola]
MMALWGTIINAVAILVGGSLGLMLHRMSPGIRNTVMQGMGLALAALGLSMTLKSSNFLLIVASLVIGGVLGELLRVERNLEALGQQLERGVNILTRLGDKRSATVAPVAVASTVAATEAAAGAIVAEATASATVIQAAPAACVQELEVEAPLKEILTAKGKKQMPVRIAVGFVNTTLIYCVGAMAILGSLDGGLRGQHDILYTKAMLDGFSAIIFASTMGVGVLFSSIPVFIYQGIIALTASGIASFIDPVMLDEIIIQLTAVGGILIMGIGVNLLEIRKINVANLLPSLLVAALAVPFLDWLSAW